MSQETWSWKQRSLAVAAKSTISLKERLAQTDVWIRRELQPADPRYIDGSQKQSWTQWMSEKVAARRHTYGSGSAGVDEIMLFPGWATRRYDRPGELDDAFRMDVFVSGYASNRRPPEFTTRRQRAFLRLAKGFAALPKLQVPYREEEPLPETILVSRSTEDLLAPIKLPPPVEIPADIESEQVEALEEQFRHLGDGDDDGLAPPPNSISRASSDSNIFQMDSSTISSSASGTPPVSGLRSDIRKLHANLESRLQPFWSTTLSSRTIRLSLFASPSHPALSESARAEERANDHGPIATQDVTTSSDGSFKAKFDVPWEDMCQHPGALHIAFGDPILEYDVLIEAEILPPSLLQPQVAKTSLTTQRISLTYSPVRVISDIDDTVKMSNIVSGARTVFYNVFVKEMSDIVIPGMGEWYNSMWSRGVRFHYVSNGPFELMPVVNEFFGISQLPPGSVRLKSYAGRSLFSGLLSAPATRKRSSILEILENFPDSRFILIGDTGEQDLELYAAIAKERPQQILGIFIRDVGANEDTGKAIEDPTGVGARSPRSATSFKDGDVRPLPPVKRGTAPSLMGGVSTTPKAPRTPKRSMTEFASTIRVKPRRNLTKLSISAANINGSNDHDNGGGSSSGSTTNFFASNSRSGSPTSTQSRQSFNDPDGMNDSRTPGAFPQDTRSNLMTMEDKKRTELQMRVYQARAQIPPHVYLRIFRKAEECVEASEILDTVHRRGI